MPLLPTYIVWNPNISLCSIGPLVIRWYSLMIILGFLGGRALVKYIFSKTGRPLENAEHFSLYVLCGALIGARLGEVFFYAPGRYLRQPLEAILPVTFTPHFQFTGYQGLSYHGALLGSMVATYLYVHYDILLRGAPWRWQWRRRAEKRESFLWLSTPLVFGVLMGFLVRIGNFIGSEIIGTPTHSNYGVLFARQVVERIPHHTRAISHVQVRKYTEATPGCAQGYPPVTIEVTFKKGGFGQEAIQAFLENNLKRYLATDPALTAHIYQPADQELDYTLHQNAQQAYVACIKTWGIPRHPVQLYESFSYLLTLLGLFFWWYRKHHTLQDGLIAGTAAIVSYGFRFFCEFFKAPFKVLIAGPHPITMGHLLSLLTVLGGLGLVMYALTRPKPQDGS
ncbi:MAG: prolipoprotein diacylglyceryl transferase [Bacteroidota bacterium]